MVIKKAMIYRHGNQYNPLLPSEFIVSVYITTYIIRGFDVNAGTKHFTRLWCHPDVLQ